MEISDKELDQVKGVRESVESKVPAGYLKIELSSKGHLGAPRVFHVRNFLTEDLMALALTEDADVQIKVADMLQELIWEKDVNIKAFHEKEVIETMLHIYENYYQSSINELEWELTDEDKAEIAKECGGEDTEEYQAKMNSLKAKKWVPRFNLNLANVKYYELDDKFKSDIKVTKKNGFTCVYSFPRYGDLMLLQHVMLNLPEFKEGDKRYAAVRENLRMRQEYQRRFDEGENVNMSRLARFPENEVKEYREYETRKAQWATRAVRALHLKEINGEYIYELPLEEKMKYADNPELDHTTFEQVSKAYQELKVGPVEMVKAFDPILRREVEVKYSFQLFTLLQALRDNKSDGTVIEFV